jgi:hypothetical protein
MAKIQASRKYFFAYNAAQAHIGFVPLLAE